MQIKDVADRAAGRARRRNVAVTKEEARQEVLIALWELYQRHGWAFSLSAEVDDAKTLAVHKVASWAVIDVCRTRRGSASPPDDVETRRAEDLPLFCLLWQELTERVSARLRPADQLMFVELLRGTPAKRDVRAMTLATGVSAKMIQRARRRIERAVLTVISK